MPSRMRLVPDCGTDQADPPELAWYPRSYGSCQPFLERLLWTHQTKGDLQHSLPFLVHLLSISHHQTHLPQL